MRPRLLDLFCGDGGGAAMTSTSPTGAWSELAPYLTTGEAAAYARCSQNAVYKAAGSGELASIQRAPGGPRLYTFDELDVWLHSRSEVSAT